jgi:hypothetical protein
VIRGTVYDVTKFLEDHPGGDDVLKGMCPILLRVLGVQSCLSRMSHEKHFCLILRVFLVRCKCEIDLQELHVMNVDVYRRTSVFCFPHVTLFVSDMCLCFVQTRLARMRLRRLKTLDTVPRPSSRWPNTQLES